jgi:hypothetical protein
VSDQTSPLPASVPGPKPEPEDDGSEGGGRRANKGVWFRAFIYVIGFHIFAGLVMLLFYVGGMNHH